MADMEAQNQSKAKKSFTLASHSFFFFFFPKELVHSLDFFFHSFFHFIIIFLFLCSSDVRLPANYTMRLWRHKTINLRRWDIST